MNARLFVIGDLQGCAPELERWLETVGFRTGQDRLVAVGDLVARGPDSLRTLRTLRALGAEAVLGNHDLHLIGCAAGVR
ncbi:MAG: diadenosine tetraphosphatase, partial [Zetaproteobacteria bacterium]